MSIRPPKGLFWMLRRSLTSMYLDGAGQKHWHSFFVIVPCCIRFTRESWSEQKHTALRMVGTWFFSHSITRSKGLGRSCSWLGHGFSLIQLLASRLLEGVAPTEGNTAPRHGSGDDSGRHELHEPL